MNSPNEDTAANGDAARTGSAQPKGAYVRPVLQVYGDARELTRNNNSRNMNDKRCYVRLGYLGEAFESTTPMVLLID